MTTFALWVDDGDTRPVGDADDLDATLDRLAEECATDPRIVVVRHPGRDQWISIAVGADPTVVSWQDEGDGALPSLVSHGGGGDGEEVDFAYSNTWSSYSDVVLVPAALARDAVRLYVTSERRPDLFAWANTFRPHEVLVAGPAA